LQGFSPKTHTASCEGGRGHNHASPERGRKRKRETNIPPPYLLAWMTEGIRGGGKAGKADEMGYDVYT
jgi:hypothetical protein